MFFPSRELYIKSQDAHKRARRERIATSCINGICHDITIDRIVTLFTDETYNVISKAAINIADQLIQELDK